MSMLPMILMRLMTPVWTCGGELAQLVEHAVERQRTCSASAWGSRWMSEAFMLTASEMRLSTISMIEASWARAASPATSDSSSSLCSRSFSARVEEGGESLFKGALGADDGTHLSLCAQPDLVEERRRREDRSSPAPGSRPRRARAAARPRRMMTLRGRRASVSGERYTRARSATRGPSCAARASTRSASVTRPSRTSTSPSRRRSICWRARAASIWCWLTRPSATSRAPSRTTTCRDHRQSRHRPACLHATLTFLSPRR